MEIFSRPSCSNTNTQSWHLRWTWIAGTHIFSGNCFSCLLMSILRCPSVDQVFKNSPNLILEKLFVFANFAKVVILLVNLQRKLVYTHTFLNFLYVNFFLSRNMLFAFGKKELMYQQYVFVIFGRVKLVLTDVDREILFGRCSLPASNFQNSPWASWKTVGSFCRERTLPFSTLWQRNGCAGFVSNLEVEILDAPTKGMSFEQSMSLCRFC